MQISAPARSPRNQLDVANQKQQFRLQGLAARAEAEIKAQQVSNRANQIASAPAPSDEQARNIASSKSVENQLLQSQIWMAPAIYAAQQANTRQETPFHPRQAQRVENALAKYQAIASIGEAESAAGLATSA
ncbi:hypothetical protein [Iodobacter sp.]|uniref:hypothetical protein n=1 Tax=Iodobacter sp. TaxID=1915058 RepID=UPI0025CEDF46|nr:hypothetical protein [Iodobacter sp.]